MKKLCELPSLGDAPIAGGMAAMYKLGWMLVHPYLWDWQSVALAGLTLFIVLRLKQILTKIFRLPGIEVIIACLLGTVLAMYGGYTGDIVGKPPVAPPSTTETTKSGLDMLTGWVRLLPWDMPWAELIERLGGLHMAIIAATAYACVDFLAIISVVPDGPPQELAGQGVACVVSGMVGSAPIGGSLSRSLVADVAKPTSPLMGFTSGVATVILAFPQVGILLAPMPKAVLAAVVLAACLPGVMYPKEVLKLSGTDALVGWITALASCFLDPTKGFGVGCVAYASLLLVMPKAEKKADKKD